TTMEIAYSSPLDANVAESLVSEARSSAFKNRAIGVGAAGLALALGVAAMLWANNQGTDPEALKAALANLPPLRVEGTVKAEGTVTLAEGATVTLADGSVVKLEPGASVSIKGG